jgi:hypothetical protein
MKNNQNTQLTPEQMYSNYTNAKTMLEGKDLNKMLILSSRMAKYLRNKNMNKDNI